MLSEVPEGWQEILLGELTSIVGGTTPKKNVECYWGSGDILWATPTDITGLPKGENYISDTATKASHAAAQRGGLKLLPANTVLMTSRATIGYVAIAHNEISTNQGFANFLPSEKYVPLFLLYLLQSKKEQLVNSAGGSTFKEISKGVLKSIRARIPPLNEQNRIAEILSSVDKSIQATQAVIEQAERVKRGLMEELLTGGLGSEAIERGEVPDGWQEILLGELTSIVGGTTPKKNVECYWDSEDILWATPTDITGLPIGKNYISDTATKASNAAAQRGGLKLLPANTVLMTSRATIGYVAIAHHEISTNQGFANFLPSEKYVPLFLLYLLQSKKEQLINSAGGSTFKEISKGVLKSISARIPPLNEQKRIAEILSVTDDFIAKQNAIVEQQIRVKKGLMCDLLTGKVRTV
jgi:type I restriction enzyme S subunit